MAWERTEGSSLLVRTITCVEGESSRKRDWTSSPSMIGMRNIDHDDSTSVSLHVTKKCDWIEKAFHLPSRGTHKATCGLQRGSVIIKKANGAYWFIRQSGHHYLFVRMKFDHLGETLIPRIIMRAN